MMTLHPGGISAGVAFQSKVLLTWLKAEILGLIREPRSKLSVRTDNGMSKFQQLSGKPGSAPLRMEMKWAF